MPPQDPPELQTVKNGRNSMALALLVVAAIIAFTAGLLWYQRSLTVRDAASAIAGFNVSSDLNTITTGSSRIDPAASRAAATQKQSGLSMVRGVLPGMKFEEAPVSGRPPVPGAVRAPRPPPGPPATAANSKEVPLAKEGGIDSRETRFNRRPRLRGFSIGQTGMGLPNDDECSLMDTVPAQPGGSACRCPNSRYPWFRGSECFKSFCACAKPTIHSANPDSSYASRCMNCFGGAIQGTNDKRPASNRPWTADDYLKDCDSGKAASCTVLGHLYANGQGVANDDAWAVKLYRKGCDMGDSNGCNRLGGMYHHARGVARDDATALELFHKACNMGDPAACNNVGKMQQ